MKGCSRLDYRGQALARIAPGLVGLVRPGARVQAQALVATGSRFEWLALPVLLTIPNLILVYVRPLGLTRGAWEFLDYGTPVLLLLIVMLGIYSASDSLYLRAEAHLSAYFEVGARPADAANVRGSGWLLCHRRAAEPAARHPGRTVLWA